MKSSVSPSWLSEHSRSGLTIHSQSKSWWTHPSFPRCTQWLCSQLSVHSGNYILKLSNDIIRLLHIKQSTALPLWGRAICAVGWWQSSGAECGVDRWQLFDPRAISDQMPDVLKMFKSIRSALTGTLVNSLSWWAHFGNLCSKLQQRMYVFGAEQKLMLLLYRIVLDIGVWMVRSNPKNNFPEGTIKCTKLRLVLAGDICGHKVHWAERHQEINVYNVYWLSDAYNVLDNYYLFIKKLYN